MIDPAAEPNMDKAPFLSCGECGNVLVDNSAYCNKCGTRVMSE